MADRGRIHLIVVWRVRDRFSKENNTHIANEQTYPSRLRRLRWLFRRRIVAADD